MKIAWCDWYLELAKQSLRSEDPAERRATQATLLHGLEVVLRLLHPFMPHLSERLWQELPPYCRASVDMLIVAPWPRRDASLIEDPEADAAQGHVNAVISAIRFSLLMWP